MKKKKSGRPSKYESEWKDKLILIEGWARDGLTDEQIANNIGISTSTLYDWKKRYLEFSESLKKGKEVIDREVENALLKKALGFKETISKPIKIKTTEYEEGRKVQESESIVYVDEELYIPPDTTAQIFWLKNRKPKEWRDKQEIDHSGNMNINNPMEGLSTEDLKKLIDK